ncbi:MAG: zinc ribbon domain-containing protein [Solirubrobacteraceae bacterium]
MPPIAYFGIESSGLSLAIDLLILFLVVLYGSLIYWTYADARRRIADPMLIGCATAASLFPFVGTIVYMILRPPEYLEDVRERELDLQAAEARLHELDYSLCPHCDYRIERDFIRCPSCLRKLKERCTSCSKPLDRAWTICPYCETEVPETKPTRRTRRERTSTGDAPSRTRAGADPELDELDMGPSRSRTSERAAVRAPETATLLTDGAPRASEPATASEQVLIEENGKPDPTKPPARPRGASRPRSGS